jgi:valyl-tRNA synthetase
MNRDIPVIGDDFVSTEFGTGMVKVTPAHDPNDYEAGKRHDLPFINLLNPDGTMNENAGPYAGLTTVEARKRVVEAMEAEGLLEKVEPTATWSATATARAASSSPTSPNSGS